MAEHIERAAAIDAVSEVYYDTPDVNLSAEKVEAAINAIPAADLVDACAENCKVYGGYVSSVEDVEEAKRELAKQIARCVERAMLDNDMFLVDGDTVRWKLLLYGGDSDADKELPGDLPGPPPMDYDLKYALFTLTEVDKKIMAALGRRF